MKKKLIIIIGSLFLILQLFPISKNQSKEYSKDISTIEKITPDVKIFYNLLVMIATAIILIIQYMHPYNP